MVPSSAISSAIQTEKPETYQPSASFHNVFAKSIASAILSATLRPRIGFPRLFRRQAWRNLVCPFPNGIS
jgi:hypothetical protein